MNIAKIEEAIKIFDKANIKQLIAEDKDLKISITKIKKYSEIQETIPIYEAIETLQESLPLYITMKADQVGYFHNNLKNNEISAGKILLKGAGIFSITSMNLNHMKSYAKDCVVKRFLVDDGSPVEYGQPIAEVLEV